MQYLVCRNIAIIVIIKVDPQACSDHIGIFIGRPSILSIGVRCLCVTQVFKSWLVALLGSCMEFTPFPVSLCDHFLVY
jgi:hypothetical protein